MKSYKKRIKKTHVIIVCSGPTCRVHKKEIQEYINKSKKAVIIGCKNMGHIIVPHYHLWGDRKGFRRFGRNIHKSSIPIFRNTFNIKDIKRYWKGEYETIEYKDPIKYKSPIYKLNEESRKGIEAYTNIKFGYKNGKMIGKFKTTGCVAIFLAFCNMAKRITVIGMDGYTFYSKEELEKGERGEKKISQHCYQKGYTNFKNRFWYQSSIRKKLKKEAMRDKVYKESIIKDEIVYSVLRNMKEYGIEFEIITPTVFKDFYNPRILNL